MSWKSSYKREFRCFEAKYIEESEKAGSHLESKPGHLACTLLLNYDNQTTTNPHNPLYYIAQVALNASVAHPLSMCCQNSVWNILSIRREPMLSGFLTINAWIILPHAGNIHLKSLYFQRETSNITHGSSKVSWFFYCHYRALRYMYN